MTPSRIWSSRSRSPGRRGRTSTTSSLVSYRPAPHDDLHHAEIARLTDPDLGPVVAYDAAQDPDACRVVVRSLLSGRRLRSPDTEVRFCPSRTALGLSGGLRTVVPSDQPVSTSLEPRVYTGQQSNTSVMLGDAAMLKVFRRLELGRNLDIEVHAALNAAQIDDVARLYGWIEGGWVSEGRHHDTDLGMVVQKLADAEDGWGLALDRLRQQESFADDAQALGRALAETHHALHAAFPTARVLGARAASVMTDRLQAAAEIAPALLTYRDGLVGLLRGSRRRRSSTPSGCTATSIWARPCTRLAVGRSSTSRASRPRPWPSGAPRTACGATSPGCCAPSTTRPPASPAPAARPGRQSAGRAFWTATQDGGLSETETAVLRAYEADKAIYEVVYEVRNRPDWVSIPLSAVASLAAAAADTNIPAQSETKE